MSTRSEHLRQLASRCALKAAAAKDSAARASLEAERKQLLILAEQAARGERNRRASPMTGLRSSGVQCCLRAASFPDISVFMTPSTLANISPYVLQAQRARRRDV